MPSVYEMKHPPEVEKVIESMRLNLAKGFGVTVVGNRVTLRWYVDEQLVSVHMIVENVTTPTEAKESMDRHDRYQALFKKHEKKLPGLRGELEHAETGEWTK